MSLHPQALDATQRAILDADRRRVLAAQDPPEPMHPIVMQLMQERRLKQQGIYPGRGE